MRSFGYGHGVVVVTHYYLNNIILFLWFRRDKVYYTIIHVEDIVGVGGCKIGQSKIIINSNLFRYLQRFVFFNLVFYLTIVISKTVFSTILPFCLMLYGTNKHFYKHFKAF